MKFSSATGLLALSGAAHAFPASIVEDVRRSDPESLKRASVLSSRGNGDAPVLPGDNVFSKDQLIDVSGDHAFSPPGPNDIRGPCPGLNALANHNYIPHNGVATVTQFLDACMNVVGMGLVLATFLSAYGGAIDGDGLSWSIGGEVPGMAGGGISNSHNKYENDASPTRPDLYQEGNDYMTQVDQFQDLIDTQPDPATANYNIQVLTDFRSKRFDHSVSTNPYFFNGPFSGILVQPAAYTFIYRFMANHSESDPVGFLNQDVLKSWFAISGESGSYTVQQGHERIPENWYRRSLVQDYDLLEFNEDILYAALKYPKFLTVGGNTGTTNSLTGVDVGNLTGGIFNAKTFTEGNNLACFAYQVAAQAKPDLLTSLLAPLTNALSPILSKLSCPQLQQIDNSQLAQYPGYSKQAATVKS